MLYFLQMSEMAMRGSKAPYTVVPAVALTKNGTKPCEAEKERGTSCSHTVLCRVCVCSSVWCTHLLFGFDYSPLQVRGHHFTTTGAYKKTKIQICV